MKSFCLAIIVFLIGLFLPEAALAQVTPTQAPPSSLEKFQQSLEGCVAGDMSLDCWIGGAEQVDPNAPSGVMPAITNSLTTMIIGPMPAPGATTYNPGGAIGSIGSFIAALYANPPASSVEYFADLGRNLGILATPAYAQGIGFEGLKPLLPVWKAFRNIAYIFFVIIFVLMGFAIMFRVKLDPQTVISIQTAIPRVVVALLLVTFSYAIAGLLIDLMYLTLFMSISLLHFAGIVTIDVDKIAEVFLKGSVFGVAPVFSGLRGGSAAINMIFEDFLSSTTGVLGTITSFLFGTLLGGTVGRTLIILVLSIVIFWKLLKLFFSLLMSYIGIMLGIIFAPLQLMLGVLPGSNAYAGWFRNLLANIMVFPAVAVFFILSGILVGSGRLQIAGTPPLIQPGATWMPPMLYVSRIQAITALIGLGMLLMCDKIPEMVKEAFQVKPLPFGTAFGEAFGPAKAAWGVAWPGGRQWAAEKYLGGGALGGWTTGVRGTIGRAGELIGAWRKP